MKTKKKRAIANKVPADENPKTPSEVYKLCEAVADIAYLAGERGCYSGDSRADMRAFIDWAREFEALNSTRDFDKDGDYISEIEQFAERKMDHHPLAEGTPACEGYRRYGGAFTLGTPRWEQCMRAAIVKLTIEQTVEPVTKVCACMVCWKEAITNKGVKIIKVEPL